MRAMRLSMAVQQASLHPSSSAHGSAGSSDGHLTGAAGEGAAERPAAAEATATGAGSGPEALRLEVGILTSQLVRVQKELVQAKQATAEWEAQAQQLRQELARYNAMP